MKYILFLFLIIFTFIFSYNDIAYVKSIKGEANIKHYYTTELLNIAEIINENDTIITFPGSFIEIEFLNDSSLIKIVSLGEIVFENEDIENLNITLIKGNIFVQTLNRMIISVEDASISSVDAVFYVSEIDSGYRVFCIKGEIVIFDKLNQMTIRDGEVLEINKNTSIQKIINDIMPNWSVINSKFNKIEIEFLDENNNKRILNIEVE